MRQSIDLVEILRKPTYSHHWSRIMKEKWSFEYRDRRLLWKYHISFINQNQWWLYIGFPHIWTSYIEWHNQIQEIAWFIFFVHILFFSVSLTPWKFAKIEEKLTKYLIWLIETRSIERFLLRRFDWSRRIMRKTHI